MGWRVAVGTLAVIRLSTTVLGFATTVFEYPASCSIPPSTIVNASPTTATIPATTQTPIPSSEPFLLALNVNRDKSKRDLEYLRRDGTLTTDPEAGLQYQIVAGQLRSSAGFVSTSGVVRFQPFTPGDVLLPVSRTFDISNGSLEWTNSGFFGGRARFCLMDSVESFVNIVFLEQDVPDGCTLIDLGLIDVDDVLEPTPATSATAATTTLTTAQSTLSTGIRPSTGTTVQPSLTVPTASTLPSPSTVIGQLAIAEHVACFQSDPNALVIPGPGFLVSNLEQCVDYCAAFSSAVSYKFAGVQFGDQCYCGNEILLPTQGTCDRPCKGNSNQVCGGNSGMSVFVLVSSIPTTPITGPVESTTTTTITSSTGYPAPTSTGDPVCGVDSPFDGTVNENFLVLCDTSLSGSDLNVVSAVDLAECIFDCRSYAPESQRLCVAVEYYSSQSDSNCRLISAISPVLRGSNPGVQAAILVNSPNAPDIVFQNPTPSNALPTSSTSRTLTTILSSTTVLSPTRFVTPTTVVTPTALPTSNTLPTSAQSQPTTISKVLSSRPTTSATVLGSSVVTASSSTATASLTATASSTAAASSIATSILVPSSRSTTSTGSSVTTSFTTSGRTSTVAGPASSSPSISTVIPKTATLPNPITSSQPTASATNTALCPEYDKAVLQPNNDGYNYEIQCDTDVRTDTDAIVANATFADTFNDCIGECTLYNTALPFQCVGVKYLTQSSIAANCLLLQTYTGNTCLQAVNVARLIYGGYPSPTGMTCGPGSTRTANPTTSTISTLLSVPTSSSVTTTSRSVTGLASSSSQQTSVASSATLRTSSSTSSTAIATSTSAVITPPPATSISTGNPAVIQSSVTTSTTPTTTTTTTKTTRPTTTTTTTTNTTTTTTTRSTTTTALYTAPACTAPPNDTQNYPNECIPNLGGPLCYGYTFDFDGATEVLSSGNSNYEIECNTQFSGGRLGVAGLSLIDLRDCLRYCDYENRQRPNQATVCVGATFLIGDNRQGESNCFLYSSLRCATRSNSSVASGRLLFAGYPEMTDYDPSFNC